MLVNRFKVYERVIKLGRYSPKYHKETNGSREVPTEVKVALTNAGSRTSDSREPVWRLATRTHEGTNRKKINNKCEERKNPTSKEGTPSMWQHPITGCRVS